MKTVRNQKTDMFDVAIALNIWATLFTALFFGMSGDFMMVGRVIFCLFALLLFWVIKIHRIG